MNEEETREQAERVWKEACQADNFQTEQHPRDVIAAALAEKDREIERLRQWVNDLHSGMYINCVYCGHRYGPDPGTPTAMADVLKAHIEQCPEHPLSAMKTDRDRWRAWAERLEKLLRDEGHDKQGRPHHVICKACAALEEKP